MPIGGGEAAASRSAMPPEAADGGGSVLRLLGCREAGPGGGGFGGDSGLVPTCVVASKLLALARRLAGTGIAWRAAIGGAPTITSCCESIGTGCGGGLMRPTSMRAFRLAAGGVATIKARDGGWVPVSPSEEGTALRNAPQLGDSALGASTALGRDGNAAIIDACRPSNAAGWHAASNDERFVTAAPTEPPLSGEPGRVEDATLGTGTLWNE